MQFINSSTRLNNQIKVTDKKKIFKKIWEQKYLFLMSLPLVIWGIIFKYFPLFGWTMAFQNYKPGRSFFQQQWVGIDQFIQFLTDKLFYMVLRNTLAMSLMSLVCGFTFPVIFALMLNEIRSMKFKRTIQTVSYLPHFVSWVVVAGMFTKLLSADGGLVNDILTRLHIFKEPIQFLAEPKLFWGIATMADLWKELGWNSIIFLAAMTAIDTELYEAAIADGAGRFRRMWHITLPGIRSTFIVLLIMQIGWLTSIGFEKQMLLGNPLVRNYSDVLDLYVLRYGLQMFRFSFGTAVGLANSVVSILLLFSANRLAKKFDEGTLI